MFLDVARLAGRATRFFRILYFYSLIGTFDFRIKLQNNLWKYVKNVRNIDIYHEFDNQISFYHSNVWFFFFLLPNSKNVQISFDQSGQLLFLCHVEMLNLVTAYPNFVSFPTDFFVIFICFQNWNFRSHDQC